MDAISCHYSDSDEDEVRVHPEGGRDNEDTMDDSKVIGAVMDDLVMDFLQVTALQYNKKSESLAQHYIKNSVNYDVEQAIQMYYDDMD